METIANLWLLWAVIAIAGLSYAIRVQYIRAQAISKNVGHTVTSILTGNPQTIGQSAQKITNDFTSGFLAGMGKAVVAMVVATISSILLLVSTIVNLINHFSSAAQ